MRELEIGNSGNRQRENGSQENKNADEIILIARKLMKLGKAKRLEEVKKLVEEIAKEKKTKQDAIKLLNALQAVVYEEKGVKKGKSELEAIEMARNYMHDRAPSVKMLLEYVMLNV
jgi:hypothetical protein